MTKEEALDLLRKRRYQDWNNYRKNNPDWIPDLSNVDLSDIKLVFGVNAQFDLTKANLRGANLSNRANICYEYHALNAVTGKRNEWLSEDCIKLGGSQVDIFTSAL